MIAEAFGITLSESKMPEPEHHAFPHEGCDCGIYGSVNLEEIQDFLTNEGLTTAVRVEGERILCVIEPVEGVDVVITRKGWKAGAAFISEIVNETMRAEDASSLLSIAWHREIDLRRLKYENR
jgi:hypothetical protein